MPARGARRQHHLLPPRLAVGGQCRRQPSAGGCSPLCPFLTLNHVSRFRFSKQAQHTREQTSLQQQLSQLSSDSQQLGAAADAARREGAAAARQAEAVARERDAAVLRCEAAERERSAVVERLQAAGAARTLSYITRAGCTPHDAERSAKRRMHAPSIASSFPGPSDPSTWRTPSTYCSSTTYTRHTLVHPCADAEVRRLSREAAAAASAARQAAAEAEQERQAGEAVGAALREREVQLSAAQGLVRDRGAELEARELEVRQLQVRPFFFLCVCV